MKRFGLLLLAVVILTSALCSCTEPEAKTDREDSVAEGNGLTSSTETQSETMSSMGEEVSSETLNSGEASSEPGKTDASKESFSSGSTTSSSLATKPDPTTIKKQLDDLLNELETVTVYLTTGIGGPSQLTRYEYIIPVNDFKQIVDYDNWSVAVPTGVVQSNSPYNYAYSIRFSEKFKNPTPQDPWIGMDRDIYGYKEDPYNKNRSFFTYYYDDNYYDENPCVFKIEKNCTLAFNEYFGHTP